MDTIIPNNQLQDLMGSILRGIAQARANADTYVRELSALYAQDETLRSFPVPRTEIKHISMDLHFATTSVFAQNLNPYQRERINDRGAQLLIGIIAQLLDFMGATQSLATGYYDAHITGGKYIIFFVSEDTKASFIATLKSSLPGYLADQVSLGSTEINSAIDAFFQYQGASLWKAAALQMEVAQDLRDAKQVNIATTSQQIKELPAHAMSSVAIESSVKNYQWSQSETESGSTTHHLILE